MDSVKTFHPRQSVILAVADSEALRNLVGFHHHDLGVDASKSYEDRASCLRQRAKMKREYFVKVVGETLDSLPQEFRSAFRTSLFWWRICRRTSHRPQLFDERHGASI